MRVKLFIFLSLISFNCWATSLKPIEIGIASNFSSIAPNSYNPFGNSVKNGALLAVEEINHELKSKGIEIILKEYDYGSNLLNVRKVVKEASLSQAIAMLGYEYSSHALLAAPLHQSLRFPMITPSASADRISQIGDYILQGTFNNSYQVEILCKYAIKNLKAKKAAIITAKDCAYCEDVAQNFKKYYSLLGGKVEKEFSVLEDQTDLAELSEYDFSSIDAIIVPNQEVTSARIIQSLLNRGVQKIFLGGDGWRTLNDIHKTDKGSLFKGYMMAHWNIEQNTPESKAFVKRYREKFKIDPTDSAVLAYDSMTLLAQTIKKMNEPYNREHLSKALQAMKDYRGITGKFIFGKNQAPRKSILLMKSSPKGFVIDKILNP